MKSLASQPERVDMKAKIVDKCSSIVACRFPPKLVVYWRITQALHRRHRSINLWFSRDAAYLEPSWVQLLAVRLHLKRRTFKLQSISLSNAFSTIVSGLLIVDLSTHNATCPSFPRAERHRSGTPRTAVLLISRMTSL